MCKVGLTSHDLNRNQRRAVSRNDGPFLVLGGPGSAKIANALGIPWYCVGDDDTNRAKDEPKLRQNLAGAEEADKFVFPYPDIEVNLLRNGYAGVYRNHMPSQNLTKMTKAPGDAGYWLEYAKQLPNRAKTRAATEVALEMEARGQPGVTPEIRSALEKVVSLARGGWT